MIGSQRDPAAYRARRHRDWTPVAGGDSPPQETAVATQDNASAPQGVAPQGPVVAAPEPVEHAAPRPREVITPTVATSPMEFSSAAKAEVPAAASPTAAAAPIDEAPAVPSRRQPLSAELEAELDQALGGMSMDQWMAGGQVSADQGAGLELESRHRGRVVGIRRDDVFLELGGREQGCLPLHQLAQPPALGDMIEVVVRRFHAEDGLYELGLPGTAVEIGDWEDVQEGTVVDAAITGHNTGGLECEVAHLRGFIPISQVALYRVEDISEFVGQKLTCLVTEANPMRRNLVLSRRAVLEREKEESRQKFFEALEPGQIHQGVVRKLMDFGAFIDLGGGADGLLHISQLSWGRVAHPRDVLAEGQSIRVKIEKVDRATGRISLAYREMLENPWTQAAAKYPTNSIVRGKVMKLMEFGAFVELEPGIEGLIHISELSHKRVWRASDVVHEGDEVEVLVLNVNPEAQRMSLSIKALVKTEPTKKEKEEAEALQAEPAPTAKKRSSSANEPLRGGLGKSAGGDRFGLNW
jgi:small subunit ribosomal protein S1